MKRVGSRVRPYLERWIRPLEDGVDSRRLAHEAWGALVVYRAMLVFVTGMIAYFVYDALCHEDAGKAKCYLVYLLCGLACCSIGIQSSLGLVPVSREAWSHVVSMFIVVFVTTMSTLMNPYTPHVVLSFMLAIGPSGALMNHALGVYLEIAFDIPSVGPRMWYLANAICGGTCLARMALDVGMRETLQRSLITWTIVLTCSFFVEYTKSDLLRTRIRLADEVQRTREALKTLRQTQKQVEMHANGMSRMLAAMCDVVVHLDRSLTIQRPSRQLTDFLIGGLPGPGIEGRSFLEFMATEEDATIVNSLLHPSVHGADDRSVHSSEGVAIAVHVRVKSSNDTICNAELFYVRIGSSSDEWLRATTRDAPRDPTLQCATSPHLF